MTGIKDDVAYKVMLLIERDPLEHYELHFFSAEIARCRNQVNTLKWLLPRNKFAR